MGTKRKLDQSVLDKRATGTNEKKEAKEAQGNREMLLLDSPVDYWQFWQWYSGKNLGDSRSTTQETRTNIRKKSSVKVDYNETPPSGWP